MNFSEAMFYKKIFEIGFPCEQCYFERVCLLVENLIRRSKAKNASYPSREKISRTGYYHGYDSLTGVRISFSIRARFVLYPFALSNKMSVSR